MYLLSLISVAFPEEMIIENTKLEEKKGLGVRNGLPNPSHPNPLRKKGTSLEHTYIWVCGTLSTTTPYYIILFEKKPS